MKAHLLFEQSGTFKKEFQKLGIDAEDYDILNEFGETDHVVDLFAEIEKAYSEQASLFDEIEHDDIILAFFPCTRFQANNMLLMTGRSYQMANWTDVQKIKYAMKLHDELHTNFVTICKLFLVALRGGYRMIVENPYTQPHYLTMYFPILPKLIDEDRRKSGDNFKKPTQYFFINCDPKNNLVFEPMELSRKYTINDAHRIENGMDRKTNRSMINPKYARRFIMEYILDE